MKSANNRIHPDYWKSIFKDIFNKDNDEENKKSFLGFEKIELKNGKLVSYPM